MSPGSSLDTASVWKARRAIVFADLVESVRLMQHDEAGAIDRWRRFAALSRERLLPAQGGRLVRTAGDGLLIECDDARAAVACAFALHDALDTDNFSRAAADLMLLRIGIHVADIVLDEHEIYGSGVNLAQRLASLASPGGTIISSAAQADVTDGVHCGVTDLGLRYVKHVPEPVRAFAVEPWQRRRTAASLAPPAGEELRPTLAVLPFVAAPADPDHVALGHAMADDIIATLSRHPGMRVLSRLSTCMLRGTQFDLGELRDLLGATFVLSGRFLVRGGRIRLNAELAELRRGHVVWTGTEHADVGALFEGQDDLVPHLVAQVAQQVLAHELVRVRSLPLESLASYTLMLGGEGLLRSLIPSDFERAHDVFEHLAERHPRSAGLQAALSDWHMMRMIQGWSPDPDRDGEKSYALAQRGLDLDADCPEALLADAQARIVFQGDLDGAERSCRRALSLSPQHPQAWASLSEIQRGRGEPLAAMQSAEQAMAQSPLDPRRFVFESFAASAALEAHRFGDAQRHARASLRRHVLHAPPHRVLICALWMDGQEDAARAAAADCLRHLPATNVGGRVMNQPGRSPYASPYARALLAAGIPP
jgi:adenylate cyclase